MDAAADSPYSREISLTLARLLERCQRDGAVPCHLRRCAGFGAEGDKDVLDTESARRSSLTQPKE